MIIEFIRCLIILASTFELEHARVSQEVKVSRGSDSIGLGAEAEAGSSRETDTQPCLLHDDPCPTSWLLAGQMPRLLNRVSCT